MKLYKFFIFPDRTPTYPPIFEKKFEKKTRTSLCGIRYYNFKRSLSCPPPIKFKKWSKIYPGHDCVEYGNLKITNNNL